LRTGEPIVLKPSIGPCGFRTLGLQLDGTRRCKRVGSLVALVFLGPRPEGAEVRRLNGITTDDRPENLAYGTRADVAADHAARARREEEAGGPTHCPTGHRYADSWLGEWGERFCPDCRQLGLSGYLPVNLNVVECTDSGREFWWDKHGPRPMWCADCRGRHGAEVYADVTAETVRYGSCIDCGRDLPPKTGSGPMKLRCAICGTVAQREVDRRAHQRYLERRGHAFKQVRLACLDCGTPVDQAPLGGPKKRCDDCTKAARRAQAAAYRERMKAERAPATRRSACRDCGAEIAKVGAGGMPVRCDPCRDAEAVAKDRRYKARQGTLKPPTTPCVDCGAPVDQHPGVGRPYLRCGPCAREERRRIQRGVDARRRARRKAATR